MIATTQPPATGEAVEAKPPRAIFPQREGDGPTEFLIRRFDAMCRLTELDRRSLREAGARLSAAARGEALTPAAGMRPTAFVVSGWGAIEYRLSDGRRQILALLLPGDEIGFAYRHFPLQAGAIALTPMELIDASGIDAAARSEGDRDDGLTCARTNLAELNDAFLCNHIVRLGALTAYERMANLFAELHWRLAQVGLARDRGTVLPTSQEVLADTLGLSAIHVSRTLRDLEADGLLKLHAGKAWLNDMPALAEAGKFTPPPLRPLPPPKAAAE